MMKPKRAIKITVDILMTFSLMFLMGYQFWDEAAHEWVGVGLFVLFIVHHILNNNWYRSLFKGKYTPYRIFQIVIDVLILIDMLALMYSGIAMSREVFAFIPTHGGIAFARRLHMLGSYWGFVLMSLHLGMHWNMFIAIVGKTRKINHNSRLRCLLLFLLAMSVAAYGLYAFISRDMPAYMLMQREFAFMDYNESKLLFYCDYLGIMGLCIFIGHYASKIIRKLKLKKKEEKL